MLDTTVHASIIKLVIAYTLLGAFIFTVIITCLSLIGKVTFADPKQQNKLFSTLVVELVVICLGAFSNFLNFAPRRVQAQIQQPLVAQVTQAQTHANQAQAQADQSAQMLQENVLKGLQPQAADLAQKLIESAKSKGIDVRLISGYRSPEEQQDYYRRGLSKVVKNSTHNTGLAFDVGVFKDGVYVSRGPEYDTVGALGKELGLVWGGDSTGVSDKPHFETKDARQALKESGPS